MSDSRSASESVFARARTSAAMIVPGVFRSRVFPRGFTTGFLALLTE
jgi:hypothetical protein